MLLQCVDFGGSGAPVLLLHGLCGTADESANTPSWLCSRARVVAFDQRGHGKGTRRPIVLKQDAFVRDAAPVIESMNLEGAIVIGQSLGGRTALRLCAHRPDLARALVLVEATPAKDPSSVDNLRRLLTKWPTSFASREEAEFFAGPGLMASTWAGSLEQHDGKLYAQFDIDVMVEIIRDVSCSEYWKEWKEVGLPTLFVAGEKGGIAASDRRRMRALNAVATFEEIAGAGHDVHLERPAAWKRILSRFLDERVHP